MKSDTTRDAAEVQRQVFAAMSGAERVEAAMDMSETAKAVAMAGIRARNPAFDEAQVLREWLVLLHGEDLTAEMLRR